MKIETGSFPGWKLLKGLLGQDTGKWVMAKSHRPSQPGKMSFLILQGAWCFHREL
jgi:hypothetical protein